jgi:hypothetical protein
MSEYECRNCGWQGSEPGVKHADNGDGGYNACPNGCTASYQGRVEPLALLVNPEDSAVIRRYALMVGGGMNLWN